MSSEASSTNEKKNEQNKMEKDKNLINIRKETKIMKATRATRNYR